MCATSRTRTPRRSSTTSRTILRELGIDPDGAGKPALIEVWNKIDRLDADARERLRKSRRAAPGTERRPVLVSAITGEGIDALDAAIEARLAAGRVLIELVLDPADGAGVSWLHRHTEVLRKAVDEKTGRIAMTVRVDPAKAEAVRGEVCGFASRLSRTAGGGSGGYAQSADVRCCARDSYASLHGRCFLRLRLVPERVHFGERCVLRRFAARGQRVFDEANRRSNFRLVCRSNASGSASRWRARLTAANRRSPTSSAAALGRSPASSAASISSASSRILRQHGARIVPVEADLARFGLQLQRAGEGGQGDRHAGERAFAARGLPRAGLVRLLLRLDRVPQALDRLADRRRASPKTCGCRRISFAVMASTTSPKSNAPAPRPCGHETRPAAADRRALP